MSGMHPILISIDVMKAIGFAFASWLTGWAASAAAGWLFFQAPANVEWYQQPAVVAAAAAALTTIIITFANRYFQTKDQRTAEEKERDHQHTTFSEKMAELAASKTQTVYDELKLLHDREVKSITENAERDVRFWKREYSIKSRGEFEGRIRAHLFANEADRYKSHILFKLHPLLSTNKIPLPEFTEKNGDQIMAEVAAQMLNFKDDLLDRYEKAMNAEDGN